MDRFCVGGWNVYPDLNTIRSENREVQLEPKNIQVLLLLARNAGEVVRKEQLLDEVWADTHVGDGVLWHAISDLRHALDGNGDGAFIETIPKVGYRLVAPVSIPADSQSTGVSSVLRQHRLAWLSGGVVLFLSVLLILLSWLRPLPKDLAFSAPVPLTHDGLPKMGPRLSPDGTRVAYSTLEPGGQSSVSVPVPGTLRPSVAEERSYNIYVLETSTRSRPLRLTSSFYNDFSPAWSADGNEIAFVREREDGSASVYSIPAGGGYETRIFDLRGRFRGPASLWRVFLEWTEAGDFLFSESAGEEDPFRIVRYDRESSRRELLTDPPRGTIGDHSGTLSANGRYLAHVRSAASSWGAERLRILDLEERNALPVRTDTATRVTRPTWSSVPQELLLSQTPADSWTTYGLSRLDIFDFEGRLHPLHGIGPETLSPSFSQGRMVYVRQRGGGAHIYRLPLKRAVLESPSAEILLNKSADLQDQGIRVSRDGSRIVFNSDRSGTAELWTCGTNGQNLVQLTNMTYAGRANWSPDGRWIAFDSPKHGNWDIYVVRSDGGQPQRLTSRPCEEGRPSWSRDGKWIYFGSGCGGSQQIWKVPFPEGGDAEQVTRNGGYYAEESWDGTSLLVSKDSRCLTSRSGLWSLALDGSLEETLLIDRPVGWRAFEPVEGGIYFLTVDGGDLFVRSPDASFALHFLNDATRRIEQIFTGSGAADCLAVGPSEDWAYFSIRSCPEEDLMLVENFY